MAGDTEPKTRADPIGYAALRERALWIARHVLPHEAALRQVVARRAPPGVDVDDIIQDVYTKFSSMAAVDHIEHPKAYAFRIASGLIMNTVRHSKVVPMLPIEGLGSDIGASDEPGPETIVIDRDELGRLARILSALPPHLAEVFRLRRIEKASQRETALRLNLPESTVEKRMARAVVLISEAFESGGKSLAEVTPLQESTTMSDRRGLRGR